VYEIGRSGRLHYFVMEFVDGMTLEERLRIGPLPARAAAEIGAAVARALHFAHDHGVVHRDVKPSNVMLVGGERDVKITDFGLARETGTGSMTESGALVGTPMYMAPEQIRGERGSVGTRADVYGLGATLYELVTSQPPFRGRSTQAVLADVLERDAVPPSRLRPDLPRPLEAIILKALEKDPVQRYGSAEEMAEDLERYLRGERVLARVPSPLARLRRRAGRHPVMTAMVLVILALSLGAVGLYRNLRTRQLETELASAESLLARAAVLHDDQQRPVSPADRLDLLHRAVAGASIVLAHDTGYARAWWVRAKALHRLQAWDDAIHDLDRAAALAKVTPELLHFRIDALRHSRSRAARGRIHQDLVTLLEIDRSTAAWALVVDYLVEVAADVETGTEREELVALARRGLGLAPGEEANPRVVVARCLLFELEGAKEAALQAMQDAQRQFEGNPWVHNQASRLYGRLGLANEAQRAAEFARVLDPPIPDATGLEAAQGSAFDGDEVREFLGSLKQLIDGIEEAKASSRRRQ
jgi:tetratricopeptide (TPR) repeat protein